MPTDKPRLTISFEPEVFEMLDTLSKLSKRPKSKIINELLMEAKEPIEKLMTALRIAQEGISDEARRRLDERIGKTQRDMFVMEKRANSFIDEIVQSVNEEVKNDGE